MKDNKLNIIHTLPSLRLDGGGPPRSVSQLCNALNCLSHKVGIITALYPNDTIVSLNEGISKTQLKWQGASFLGRARLADFPGTLSALGMNEPISLIHQHGLWLRSSHAVTSYAHRRKLPLVIAPRGMLQSWAINNSKWKKKLAWALYQRQDLRRATAFHATAHSEAESIRRLGFKQPIAVIPNGVHLPKAIECEGGEVKKLKSGVKTALFLSRIHPKKGLPMLLDAWKKLLPEGWRLVIAGNDDGGHVAELQAQIECLGLCEKVSYAGSLFGEAKEKAYREADLFVLPSYSENFGIVVAEALGYQVPVLTTTGCPWQELETHKCGWWVEPSAKGIEGGLRNALGASCEQRREMGMRGRELIKQRYLWPAIAADMSNFYRWLLGQGEKPDFIVL